MVKKVRKANEINKQFAHFSTPISDDPLTDEEIIGMKKCFKDNPGAFALLEYCIDHHKE